MTSLGDGFRRAAAGIAQALGLRRPGTTLVAVGQPEPLPPPGPSSRKPRALPAPPRSCAHCGRQYPARLAAMPRPQCPVCNHLPPTRSLPQSSPWAVYGRVIAPEMHPNPQALPLGRGPAHDLGLVRDRASPWRAGGTAVPPPDPAMAALREEVRAGPAVPVEQAPAGDPGQQGYRLLEVIRRLGGRRPPWL